MWGPWSICSKTSETCCSGEQTRVRKCIPGDDEVPRCPGTDNEIQACDGCSNAAGKCVILTMFTVVVTNSI